MKASVTLHKEGNLFVAIDTVSGMASQGKTCDEALKNFKKHVSFGLRMLKNGKNKTDEITEVAFPIDFGQ